MEEKRIYYKSDDVTVSYNPKLCIHAKECVHGLPSVFDIDKKPWINPEGADAEAVAAVIERCPTGALKYERLDGEEQESAPEETSISVQKDGPIYLRGDIEVFDSEGNRIAAENRLAICRCGASKNKPFCDNTHLEVGFNGE